jgi:RNA polymerase sigma-70 factor (ECF subfamily)
MTSTGLSKVYLACRAQLMRAISRLVPPHEIEDIVQETYVRICQFKPAGEIREPQALMVRIARNLALDHIKRAENRLTSTGATDDGERSRDLIARIDETFEQAASDQEFARFCEAVRQLPQQCRRVFVLKKVYGHSQKEIARELGLSENTVEKHIAKGVRACAHYMRQQQAAAATAGQRNVRRTAGTRT